MNTLKKEVKWRKDRNAIFICDCKRLIDLKLDFKYENSLKKIFRGINSDELIGNEKLILEEFKKMNLLVDLELKKLLNNDFSLAMKILDNELGKNRSRNTTFLEAKFKEFPNYFIGIYLGKELVGVICGFPREDYLLIGELAVDFRFQRRRFGEKLVKKFEKIGFEKFNKINVGALNNAIEFYKSLNYDPFLLIQFEKGIYSKKDFSRFEILSVKDYGVELKINECNPDELNKLRKIYPKANLQYIFTKKIGRAHV